MKRFFEIGRLMVFCILSSLLLVRAGTAQPVYENYTVTTLAGPAEQGASWQDGLTNVARFGTPSAVAKDASGNIYVADPLNQTIRKITPDGIVSTVAGFTGEAGSTDGIGAAARFKSPFGIAVDGAGNLFVADTGNHTIRKITPAGLVTTFAGLAGVSGTSNGLGSSARFFSPYGVMVDQNNTVYVADTFNNTIRSITPDGLVSTLAGKAGVTGSQDKTGTAATFTSPVALAMDSNGNIYVSDNGNDLIRKIAPGAVVTTLAGSAGVPGSANGTNGTARFNAPFGITVDSADDIYLVDAGNFTIRKVTLAGVVTTSVGLVGATGNVDGIGDQARLGSPRGVAAGNSTDVVIADFGNSSIRKAIGGTNVVTLAGAGGGVGSQNGSGSAARFNGPAGTALDAAGNIYVADEQNDAIRKITPQGDVSTFAGTMGVVGSHDDTGTNATFNRPLGLAFDTGGSMYVTDSRNHTIRKITPDGVVTTFAGLAGTSGTNDGVGSDARFNTPFCLAIDAQTNVYVSDTLNHTIRKITVAGVVSTLAGTPGTLGTNNGTGLAARFAFPEGIAVDPDGNVFVADDDDFSIRKITPDGVVTTFSGAPGSVGSSDGVETARFNFPFGMVMDANRNLFLNDTGNHTIRKIKPDGTVTTLAGVAGVSGNVDGTGSDARFGRPAGIAVTADGTLYISDEDSHVIRKAYPAPPDMPTVDSAAAHVGVTRHFGISNQTTTSWSWTLIRKPAASSAQIVPANGANPTFTPDVEDNYLVRFQGWDNSGRTVIRTLTLYADDTAPSIAITNPVSGVVVSNSVLTVRGTATDNLGFSNVLVQLNGGDWMRATGTVSWSLGLSLEPGTNVIRAYAEDFAGNVSATNEVGLTYIVSAPLTVQINGGGTVTPNLNGVLLEIGRTYSMTAQPGAGCSFVNWTGSLETNSPTLTFVMQPNLTFIANFTDPIKPTLVITSPQKGGHVSNDVFTATGTASDNGQLASVWYRLNGGDWVQAINTSNWTAGLSLSNSANTLQAYAVDTFNNASTTNSITFTYVPSRRMTVQVAGQGTCLPNYDGWMLQIGKSYKMTATPAFNAFFSSWTDGAGNTLSTSPSLTFVVQSNTTLRANFIFNPFPALGGPFAGLFYDTNNIGATNSGSLSLTVNPFGSFSAKAQFVSGQSLSFSGTFTTDGLFSNSVAAKGSAPFVVQLVISSSNGGQVVGTIGNSAWTSSLTAVRAPFSPANPAPQKDNYTLVIPGGDDSTVRPAGNGYATVGVDISGNVNLSGVLADGTKVKQKTFINQQGVWPLYVSPYKGQGAIFGWMIINTNLVNTDMSGQLYWFRLPQSGSKVVYPGGFNFPGGIAAVGSVISAGAPLLNLPSGGVAVLQLGNPVQSFTNTFTVGANNKITSPDGLSVTITSSSGLFKGTARSLGNDTSVPINGVLLQKQNSAYGTFLSNGQSGSVYLGQ